MEKRMTKYWQQAVRDLWGIKGRFRQLDGEYDLNFRIDSTHILKVMRDGCQTDFVDLQCCALNHLRTFSLPLVVPSQKGRPFEICKDEKGCDRILWVLENLDGKTWAEFKPKTRDLILKLGETIGVMDNELTGFDHSGLYREFKWHLPSGDWIADNLGIIADATRQKIIRQILDDFAGIKAGLDALPSQAIHNDINDYNILVTGSLHDSPAISGIIDLGDMCAAPVVCDLAIAAAYVVLDHPNPESALEDLVKGFHSAYPLSLKEIDMIWPLLRLRLAVSVVNSTMMAQEKSDDPYVLISQGPAWAFLESRKVNPDLIAARLRVACGLGVNDSAKSIMEWLDENRGCFAQILGQPLDTLPRVSLSVAESTLPQNPFDLTPEEATTLGVETQGFHLGYYAEPRLIYTDKAFYKGPFKASNRRTVHIGVDIFAPAGTRVHAPLNATVEAVENRKDNLDYGGLVILRHEIEKGAPFFTAKKAGRNIHFGVREHAMGAAINGMALSGMLIPYCGTFLIFSDYLRPASRLAALMGLHCIYVMTHDSIGLGEDGPTHQPIEHLASYRAMPNMTVIRPADANETIEAWKAAIRHRGGPVMLALSRQGLPTIDRSTHGAASGVRKGAYVLKDTKGRPDIILIASGSEVSLCLDAAEVLRKRNVGARVVSMASMEIFEAQPDDYKRSVLPPSVTKRIAVEAAATYGWERYVGLEGRVMGIDTFGESAPAGDIYRHFGLTVENIVKEAAVLKRRKV